MISVTILTKDSEKWIGEVLEALRAFDEVLIYDTGSTDRTMEFASRFQNVSLYQGPFEGFGPTHNRASALARHDWILSIDSDEVMTDALREEIEALTLDPGSVYSFPRQNTYHGKWIRGCGWHPDRVFRLYHRKETRFTNDKVHEKVIIEGKRRIDLQHAVQHYPYETTEDFLRKMQSYSTLFAKQNRGKRKAGVFKALLRGAYTFFKNYLLQRGVFCGAEGFVIAVYNANTTFYKYLKLAEANRSLAQERADGRRKKKGVAQSPASPSGTPRSPVDDPLSS